MKAPITLFTSSTTWIEGEAIRQLERAAALPGMVRVVGFPDLHPGKGYPIGAAMLSEGVFYPYLAGSDIGCSMSMYATGLASAKGKPEKWIRKLRELEEPWDGDVAAWLEERGVDPEGHLATAGTAGHGNHFRELLQVQQVLDEESFSDLSLSSSELLLLVHSGSRSLGEMILRDHTDRFRDGSLKAGSPEAEKYLARHANALRWAEASRELIAYRFQEQLGSGYRKILDQVHNSITALPGEGPPRFLHRKGAAPADQGPVVIPGSRGTLTYLVMPLGNQDENLWSLAHGAGRKWGRSECEGRLRGRYTADSLRRTKLGGYVVCADKDLLFEEAPQAYKDIDSVISDLESFGLIRVIATFSPLITYK